MKYRFTHFSQVFVFLTFTAVAALGQQSITLSVDASEAARNIIHVKEKLAVRPGKFSLFYPKWIPGEHSPTGPLNNMVNLHITAGGKAIAWQRDDVEMFAIHFDIPVGVRSIDIAFDDVEMPGTTGSAALARIKWNRMLVYPRGVPADHISVSGSLRFPAGWQFATALPVTRQTADSVDFGAVTLERFVDSPAIIGKNFKKVPLSDNGVLHEMDIAADTPEALVYKPEILQGWRNLIIQANLMFGARHYNSYRFLLTLSDVGGDEGLEHNESSEDGTGLNAFTDPEELADLGDLLSHEYTHSWNGKYRRPASLTTPDFERPMVGDLLWVYEGLTEYIGNVLPARSGLWTPETFRETVADVAAQMQHRTGRRWRPLVDTARAAQFTYSARGAWENQRRSPDYYYEGQLIWMEADVLIRQKTDGKRSLDDFFRKFHGGTNTGPLVKPYTYAEVVATLNTVLPYDWDAFLKSRVYTVQPDAPLGGIMMGGWRLEYTETPNIRMAGRERLRHFRSFMYSAGFEVSEEGRVTDINPDLAAARAGLAPGMRLLGKNGKDFSMDDIEKAIDGSAKTKDPITLIAENGGVRQTYSLDYNGGARYPHLVRDTGHPDILSEIIKPR